MQVEGEVDDTALGQLRDGVRIQGRRTLPAEAESLADPCLPERNPPIRARRSIPTSWLAITLREGRNRQVRRMTAAVGLPTLRLLRVAIDLLDGEPPLNLEGLEPGQWRPLNNREQTRMAQLLRGPAAGQPRLSRGSR